MKYYESGVVRDRIELILSDQWEPHPNIPEETRADALFRMFSAMTDTVYSAGRLEVQNGVVDALGLRHLLMAGR